MHAHQVTFLSLSNLQLGACNNGKDCQLDKTAFVEWKKLMCAESPTLKYWELILQLEMLILIYVRSHRE